MRFLGRCFRTLFWLLVIAFVVFNYQYNKNDSKRFIKSFLEAFDAHVMKLPQKWVKNSFPHALLKEADFEAASWVKTLEIPGFPCAYNPSLVQDRESDGYLLSFRYDGKGSLRSHGSYIGMARFDRHFCFQEMLCSQIETGSPWSEDARLFWWGDRLFMLYNEALYQNRRGMKLAEVCEEEGTIIPRGTFEGPCAFEKNWTSLVAGGELFLIHYLEPYSLMQCQGGEAIPLLGELPVKDAVLWKKKWGELRGGTPAVLLEDGSYLTIFHSCFEDEKTQKTWYVMGACLLDGRFPFKLRALSKAPICYERAYEATQKNARATRSVRCLFPMGLVKEETPSGQCLLHVSCGENDTAMVVMTLDLDAVLKGMQTFHEDIDQGYLL